jgi:uridylate kinase
MSQAKLKYQRVLLKISGEGFCSTSGFGIEAEPVRQLAKELKQTAQLGLELAVVCGGGNFLRGQTLTNELQIPRASADYMGMLATVMNAIALQECLEGMGQPTRVLSAIPVKEVCEPFIHRRAVRHLEKGRIVILAGGTGNPFFSTDTCAALRASELHAEAVLKATKVEGVYSADPEVDSQAELYEKLDFHEVLSKDLKVMDHAAISLCRMNKIPIVVFNVYKSGNIERVVQGEKVGTTIGDYGDGPR